MTKLRVLVLSFPDFTDISNVYEITFWLGLFHFCSPQISKEQVLYKGERIVLRLFLEPGAQPAATESRKSRQAVPCPIHRCAHKTALPSSLRPIFWGMAHTRVVPSSNPKIITSWKLRAGTKDEAGKIMDLI